MWEGFAGAALSGLANLGGGIMSAGGAAAANQANLAQTNMINQQMLNAEMAKHAQNTAFMEDQQAFNREERQYAENFNAVQAHLARNFAAGEARWSAQTQMDFQERMANTQYQRAMADMKAAGLNPILAYKMGGNAAPGGSGAQASGPSATSPGASSGMATGSGAPSLRTANILNDREAIGRAMGNFVTTALNVVRGLEDIDLIREKQQTERNYQRNLHVDSAKKVEETFKTNAEIENTKAQNALIKAQTTSASEHARVAAGEAGNLGKYGSRQAPDTIERMLRTLEGWFSKNGGSIMPPPPAWDNSRRIF